MRPCIHIVNILDNANKPAKYGLLHQILCDSSIPYNYYSLPYAGKPEKLEGPVTRYFITGTDEYSKYLINELHVYCNQQGINISMDRYFTSISLATWALEKNITIADTMRHDRKNIPKECSTKTVHVSKKLPLHWTAVILNIFCKYLIYIYIFFQFECGFCRSFSMIFPKDPAPCYKKC